MRRIFSNFLAIVLVLSGMSINPAQAATCYTLTGTTVSAGSSCSGAITFPDTVTAIAGNAFQDATSITSITFGPESMLTSIGAFAFAGATSLETITFGPGSLLTSIGAGAFAGANHLTGIAIPNGVTLIEPFAFSDTTSLASLTISTNVTTIGAGAFNSAAALTSIVIPSSVTSIGSEAFSRLSVLNSLTFATGSLLTTIESGAFYRAIVLPQVIIPASVTTIGGTAFADTFELESIYFSGLIAPTVGVDAFAAVKSGAKAYIQTGATGFEPIDGLWKGLVVAPATTAPTAPTIVSATAISPTSASISFTAPTSNGGATIETYTATSTPGSVTGRVLQSGSGSITVTGLTSSTAYTFRVTAANSAGTSSASSASVSITTPASDAEVAAQVAAFAAAALAEQKAAEAKREAEKQAAQTEIWDCLTESRLITINNFNSAEIYGVTKKNYDHVIQDINYKLFDESNTALIESQNLTIFVVEQVVKKYVILDSICYPGTFSQFTANDLASVDLIPYKNRNAITYNLRQLPLVERNDYIKIENAINNEILVLETRKERLNEVLAWDYPEKNLVAEPASTGTFPCGSGGTYTVVSGHVTGSDKCAGKLTFVSSVTAIDDYAFAQSRYIRGKPSTWISQEPQITELVVPNTVKSIGASAFSDNEFLITVSISDSVKTIGREAFRQSNNVTSLTIGSGAALIESDTYQEFRYLTKLVVPEGVTRIDAGAFSELYSVTSLSLPSTLVTLGEASLRGMHSLRTMNIPANLSITYDPFHYFWYAHLSAPYLCSTTGASNTSSVNAYFATLIAYNTTAGRCTNSFEAPEIVGAYRQSPTTATLKFIAPQSFGAGTAHTSYEVIAFPGGKRTSFPGGAFTQKVTISSLNPGTSYWFEVVAINNESPFIASPPSRRRYVSAE
jgi:hypothetical protein